MDAIDCLLTRRTAKTFAEPGPTPDELDTILRAAAAVPDHGRLRPWRFVVVTGDGRAALGDALAAATTRADPDATGDAVERQRSKPMVAPAMIVLVATPRVPSRIPAWEQVASAACTGQNVGLAAHALGLAAAWKSTPYGDDPDVRAALDLADGELLLGWVLLGRRSPDDLGERPAVPVADRVATLARR